MKNNRKIIYATLSCLCALSLIMFVIIRHGKNAPLKIVFLDVEQGDSILISDGSQQLLIDGGKDGKLLLEKLGKHIPFWDRNIEAVIETHPDQDHIGGLIDVMGTYKVDSVLKTDMRSGSQTFSKLEEVTAENNARIIEAKKGVAIKFANGAVAEVIYPLETVIDTDSKDTNMYSVVVMLKVGENKFLLTGDLPTTEEGKLVGGNHDMGADFLKVAHHGSKYSTSNDFLDEIRPSVAIISVGRDNSYGHPNPEVLQRLARHGIETLRTDELGDIAYECHSNGKCVPRTL